MGQKRNRYPEDQELKQRRRWLRLIPTKAEYVLWQELRRKAKQYRFRRQASIGKYIVDFYCHELRLIIEVDGPIHDRTSEKEYDEYREAWLKQQGYTVIRFLNNEVLFNREETLQRIEEICKILSESHG